MNLRFPRDWGEHRHPVNIRHVGERRTFGERVADGVAASVGSWPFIITQSILLGLWLLANAVLIRDWVHGAPFDPYPFILLNLVLSFQAAYTGPVVMMSQNRQAAKDRDEAEHDYEVNRRALAQLDRMEARQQEMDQMLRRLTGDGEERGTASPGP